MGELLSGGEEQVRARGADGSTPPACDATSAWPPAPGGEDAWGDDLDAYLERELSDAPDAEDAGSSEEEDSAELRVLLSLAEEELRWLTEPPSTESPEEERAAAPVMIPAWMRENPSVAVAEPVCPAWAHARVPSPPPVASRGFMWSQRAAAPARPNLQERPWGVPMMAPPAYGWDGSALVSRRGLDIVSGVLLGVAVVGALAAGMLVVASVRLWDVGAFRPVGIVSSREGMERLPLAGTRAPMDAAGSVVAGREGAQRLESPETGVVVGAIPSVPSMSTSDLVAASSMRDVAAATNVGDIAAGLHAPAAQVLAPESLSTADSAEALAREDTLAVASRVRHSPVDTTAREVPESAQGESVDAANVGAVQEMTFEDTSSPEDSATSTQDEAVDEESAAESELDEEFARELGFADEAANEDTEPTAARTVYVPPELGEKEHLTADDIQQVVMANQPAITECLREHAADSLLEKGGRFVVSWSVQPGGETTDVAMDTPALRSTPVARCIEDVVRGWKFPMHAVRMPAPIHFPFVF